MIALTLMSAAAPFRATDRVSPMIAAFAVGYNGQSVPSTAADDTFTIRQYPCWLMWTKPP